MNQKNLELARSKFLLDKLTGKLIPDPKGGRYGQLPKLDGETVSRAASMADLY